MNSQISNQKNSSKKGLGGSPSFLEIQDDFVENLNSFFLDKSNNLIVRLLEIIDLYGGAKEINRRGQDQQAIETQKKNILDSERLADLEWLQRQVEARSFVSTEEYRRQILGRNFANFSFDKTNPTTLEISACNFFDWFMVEAKTALKKREVMPARFIRVRSMEEQVKDGDIWAFAAAMNIIGASYVQTLGSKGTALNEKGEPVNVHLSGPETITGYFGGIGAPNDYAFKWVEEYLYYYTNYGVQEVLNVNLGTVMLGFLLYKLGVDIKFKISVFLGIDNPYSFFAILALAKLFARSDGSTPLSGLNLSNSTNVESILEEDSIRQKLGFVDKIRIEHHITEAYKGIVRQPYDKLTDLLCLNGEVRNLSAKHEGGVPGADKNSDIADYFLSEKEIREKGLWQQFLDCYLLKHDAVNRTARELTLNGLSFLAAPNLHPQ